ncbi:hypothetical protein B0H67DRAFT_551673 [Lasiosphaeris hirsuta]|uniref:Uncharacterized protein n=1 Tax=Lasiosphaeris hirsuta TaxID=260670 RepID=A0AA40ANV2_9PEZI|nr:hypothetical protein B0H67DRAFT_551673 [Lasiosphaeris hirsuta]
MYQTAGFRRSLTPVLAAAAAATIYINQGNAGMAYPVFAHRDWAMGQTIFRKAIGGTPNTVSSLHPLHLRLDGKAFTPISSAFAKLIKGIDFVGESLLLPDKAHKIVAVGAPDELPMPLKDETEATAPTQVTPAVCNAAFPDEKRKAASEGIAETYDAPGERDFELQYAVTVGGEVFWYRPDVEMRMDLSEEQFQQFEALYPNWASAARELASPSNWDLAGEDELFDDSVIDRLALLMGSGEVDDDLESSLPEQPREVEEPREIEKPREASRRRSARLETIELANIVEETEEELFYFLHEEYDSLDAESTCAVDGDASSDLGENMSYAEEYAPFDAEEDTEPTDIAANTEEQDPCDGEEDTGPTVIAANPEEQALYEEIVNSWKKHSYIDETGYINTQLNAHATEGTLRLPRLSSVVLLPRRQLVGRCSGPEITVTTPEGEVLWPHDIASYPKW